MLTKHYNIPIFVPHAGCPFDCVFCNQKHITGQDDYVQENFKDTIEEHLTSILKKKESQKIEIAFFGGSFTGIPTDLQNSYLAVAKSYLDKGLIHGIRLSTRPDYINDEIVTRLLSYGVTTIELGVQSLDYEVLCNSNRGHTEADVEKAVKAIRKSSIQLGLQMMIGLPGDTREKTLKTAYRIHRFMPDFVRIYPTLIIKDTALEVLYKKNLYKPLSLDEAVKWALELDLFFKSKSIPIIRMGLQPTSSLEDSLVGGPYHQSFKQLVESLFYKRVIDDVLGTVHCVHLTIECHSKISSYIIGQKRSNLDYLESKYDLNRVKVKSVSEDIKVIRLHFDSDSINKQKVSIKINYHLDKNYEIM